LAFGNSYNDATKSVEGNAVFLVDYKSLPFELLVQIEGAISIPKLKTYGEVNINITDEG